MQIKNAQKIYCPNCNSENIQQFDFEESIIEDPIVNFLKYIITISKSVHNQTNIIYTIIAVMIFMIFKAIFASENNMETTYSLAPLLISILGIIIFIALIHPLSTIILHIYKITISANLFLEKIPYDFFTEDEGQKKVIEITNHAYKTLGICVILSLLMILLSLIFKVMFFLPNEILNLWSSLTGHDFHYLYFNFDPYIKTGIWCSIVNIIILSFLFSSIKVIGKNGDLYICKSCNKIIKNKAYNNPTENKNNTTTNNKTNNKTSDNKNNNTIDKKNLMEEEYKIALSYFREKRYSEAIKSFIQLAKNGNSQATFILGSIYEDGEGVDTNIEKAKYWYKRGAEQGNEDAKNALINLESNSKKQFEMAIKYYKEKKFEEAFKHLIQPAENGNPEALYYLGIMYEYGEGIEVNIEKAKHLYKKSADLGNENAKEAFINLNV